MLPSKCRHYLECNNPVLPTLVQSYIWVCADLWLDQRCSDIKALSSRGWGLGTGCDRGFGKGRELRGESVRQGLKRVRWKDGAFVSGLWTTHYGWVVNPHFLSQKSLNERSKWYAIKKTKSWVEWPFFSVLFPFFLIFFVEKCCKMRETSCHWQRFQLSTYGPISQSSRPGKKGPSTSFQRPTGWINASCVSSFGTNDRSCVSFQSNSQHSPFYVYIKY